MSGSELAPFVIAAVMVPILFIWIAMVFYADSHPDKRSSSGEPATRASSGLPGGVPRQQVFPGGVPGQPSAPAGDDLNESLRAEWERAQRHAERERAQLEARAGHGADR